MMLSTSLRIFSVLLLAAGLSACATAPSDPAERAEFERLNDPLEPANRAIFEFNQVVDRILLKPAAEAYRYVMPDFAQQIVGNVLHNAGEPVRMANAALQGRVTDAHNILNRFIANTVGGLGGIADVAAESGLGPINADFGQTLHVWGMPEGPYLVLPILGPSNPRDAIGFAGDSLAQPWGYVIEHYRGNGDANRYTIASVAGTAVHRRAEALDALESLEKGSLDFYAQLRSVSRQYRNKQLGISAQMNADDFDAFDDEAPAPKPKAKTKKPSKKAAKPQARVSPHAATPVAATQSAQAPSPNLAMEPVMPLPSAPPAPIVPVSAPAAPPTIGHPTAMQAVTPAVGTPASPAAPQESPTGDVAKKETAPASATAGTATDSNIAAPAFGVPHPEGVPAVIPAVAPPAPMPPVPPIPPVAAPAAVPAPATKPAH